MTWDWNVHSEFPSVINLDEFIGPFCFGSIFDSFCETKKIAFMKSKAIKNQEKKLAFKESLLDTYWIWFSSGRLRWEIIRVAKIIYDSQKERNFLFGYLRLFWKGFPI